MDGHDAGYGVCALYPAVQEVETLCVEVGLEIWEGLWKGKAEGDDWEGVVVVCG